MAKPESRGQLINFGLRKLGYPVLEINHDTDQIHDALDDTVQLYDERHYNGIERMYLKYKISYSIKSKRSFGGKTPNSKE